MSSIDPLNYTSLVSNHERMSTSKPSIFMRTNRHFRGTSSSFYRPSGTQSIITTTTMTNYNNVFDDMDDQTKFPLLILPKDIMTQTSKNDPFISFENLLVEYRNKIKQFQDHDNVSSNINNNTIITTTTMRNFYTNDNSRFHSGSRDRVNNIKRKLEFNKEQEYQFNEMILKESEKLHETLSKSLENKRKLERSMLKVRICRSKKMNKPTTGLISEQNCILKKDNEDNNQSNDNRLISLIQKTVKLFWYEPNENTNWYPEAREGAAFVIYGRYGYLYGGASTILMEGMEIIDTRDLSWKRVIPKVDFPKEGRMGHTANLFKKKIVVFGGEMRFVQGVKARSCLNDVRIYLIESNEWENTKPYNSIEPRRNHVAVIVGKHLIVHGGINSQGHYLNELVALDLNTMHWDNAIHTGYDDMGVAFHSACLVLSPLQKDINLYHNTNDTSSNEKISLIKYEGIYFFGGKNANGEILNTLKILKIGQKPLEWIKPQVNGQGPSGRFQHTMLYCQRLNAIIIYGGRNDKILDGVFNDVYILELANMSWLSVQYIGNQGIPRYSHVSGIFGRKMLVFGGISNSAYVGAATHILELDTSIVKTLEKEMTIYGKPRTNLAINEINENGADFLYEKNPKMIKYQEAFDYLKKFENLRSFAPKLNKNELQNGETKILGFVKEQEDKKANSKNPRKFIGIIDEMDKSQKIIPKCNSEKIVNRKGHRKNFTMPTFE